MQPTLIFICIGHLDEAQVNVTKIYCYFLLFAKKKSEKKLFYSFIKNVFFILIVKYWYYYSAFMSFVFRLLHRFCFFFILLLLHEETEIKIGTDILASCRLRKNEKWRITKSWMEALARNEIMEGSEKKNCKRIMITILFRPIA